MIDQHATQPLEQEAPVNPGAAANEALDMIEDALGQLEQACAGNLVALSTQQVRRIKQIPNLLEAVLGADARAKRDRENRRFRWKGPGLLAGGDLE